MWSAQPHGSPLQHASGAAANRTTATPAQSIRLCLETLAPTHITAKQHTTYHITPLHYIDSSHRKSPDHMTLHMKKSTTGPFAPHQGRQSTDTDTDDTGGTYRGQSTVQTSEPCPCGDDARTHNPKPLQRQPLSNLNGTAMHTVVKRCNLIIPCICHVSCNTSTSNPTSRQKGSST